MSDKLLKLKEERSKLYQEAVALTDKEEELTKEEEKRWMELSDDDGLIAKKDRDIEAEERKEEIRKKAALDQAKRKEESDAAIDRDWETAS